MADTVVAQTLPRNVSDRRKCTNWRPDVPKTGTVVTGRPRMESEANAPGAGSSVFNQPPRPRATPTVVQPHAPARVQTPATTTPAAIPDAERRTLEDQRRRGGQWFYWIAGLSLINAVLAFSGQDWRFILGLGITQVVQELAEQSGGAGVKAGVVGLAMIA